MMSGKSCMLQGATIAADFGSDQLFERGNKKFGKFFLISAAANMNRWRVEPHTIPERLRTFIGRPFISEPKLAHFGAENMSTDEIVKKQEEYSVGTIKDVVMKEDGTSFAVVEFKNTEAALKVWDDMKKGRAIYTSPAVTGYAHMEGSQKVFHDWFGLHLARVGDPAFGVFHASLKETCEGDEATCVRNLIASAAVIMNSSHVASESNNQSMMANNEKNATAMTEEEMKKKKLEDDIASLTAKMAALEDKVNSATSQGSGRIPGSEGQTTPVTDAISANETQSGKSGDEVVMPKGAQASALEKNPVFQKMQTQLAAYEQRDKQAVIDQIIDISATAGMITEETEIAERERLSKLSLEKLQETASVIEAPIKKMVELAARFGEDLTRVNDGSRLVKMPQQTGTASTQRGNLPKTLKDCRTEWYA